MLEAARETRTALELNGALPRLDPPLDVLRSPHARDVTFVLTSDAHDIDELALVDNAAAHAHRAHLSPEQIANAWDPQRLQAWATSAGPS